MNIHYDCTMCGKCCHDLKLPLSLDEAASWLRRGGAVQLLCEASPWPEEPAADDAPALYRRARSFAAVSAALPVRIGVTLVAAFDGACPHLLADMRCGGYDERPSVCRIYPAEVNPFLALMPERKSCPPEAWAPTQPLYAIDGHPVDAATATLVAQARATGASESAAKMRLCASLGIDRAALANEGFAVHAPADLRAAIDHARSATDPAHPAGRWRIVSNRAATLAMLRDAGADGVAVTDGDDRFSYLGFFPND